MEPTVPSVGFAREQEREIAAINNDISKSNSLRQMQNENNNNTIIARINNLDSQSSNNHIGPSVKSDGLEQKVVTEVEDDAENGGIKFEEWGFKVDRLFEARYGNFDANKAPDVGALDLIGKSRRYQWSLLKDMSKTEAMSKFICTLDEICPTFKAFAEAVKISSKNSVRFDEQSIWNSSSTSPTSSAMSNSDLGGHQSYVNTEGDNNSITINKSQQQSLQDTNSSSSLETTSTELDDQLNAIRTSLNRQTYEQFKSYADQQFPNDKPKIRNLISTLQEQYYQQYVAQMHPELSKIDQYVSDKKSTDCVGDVGNESNASEQRKPTEFQGGENLSSNSELNELKIPTTQTNQLSITNSPVSPVVIEIPLNGSNQKTILETTHIRTKPETLTKPIVEDDIDSNNVSSIIEELAPNIDSSDKTKTSAINSSIWSASPIERTYFDTYPSPPQHAPLVVENATIYKPEIRPQDIGQFESFPEPRPVANNNNKTQLATNSLYKAINLFKPKQESRAIENPSETESSLVQTTSESQLQQVEASNRVQNIPFVASKEATLSDLPMPYLPLPSPPIPKQQPMQAQDNNFDVKQTSQESYNLQNNINTELLPPVSNALEVEEKFAHQEQSQCITKPPVETWDCEDEDLDQANCLAQREAVYQPLEPANIWTKKGVLEFKESLMDDKHGGFYVVNQGSLLKIQVPTYPDGRFIQWEFATDYYDIAFGLDFVYDDSPPSPLALKIYEEFDSDYDDDEELENYDGPIQLDNGDVESSTKASRLLHEREAIARKRASKLVLAANTMPIIPTYRRDSHEEVFIGRHRYPGNGYYLLKFDNTYSVLRSKTLFYRICYLI